MNRGAPRIPWSLRAWTSCMFGLVLFVLIRPIVWKTYGVLGLQTYVVNEGYPLSWLALETSWFVPGLCAIPLGAMAFVFALRWPYDGSQRGRIFAGAAVAAYVVVVMSYYLACVPFWDVFRPCFLHCCHVIL